MKTKLITKSEIIKHIKTNTIWKGAEFYVTKKGDLTMSLDGDFVDHTWKAETFINK